MRLGEPVGLAPRSVDDVRVGAMARSTAASVRLMYGRSGPGLPSSSTELTGRVTMEVLRTVLPGF